MSAFLDAGACKFPPNKQKKTLRDSDMWGKWVTFWHGDLATEVIVLVQTGVGHFLQPGSLQLREALDGDWGQTHAAPRQAAPGEVTLEGETRFSLVWNPKTFIFRSIRHRIFK